MCFVCFPSVFCLVLVVLCSCVCIVHALGAFMISYAICWCVSVCLCGCLHLSLCCLYLIPVCQLQLVLCVDVLLRFVPSVVFVHDSRYRHVCLLFHVSVFLHLFPLVRLLVSFAPCRSVCVPSCVVLLSEFVPLVLLVTSHISLSLLLRCLYLSQLLSLSHTLSAMLLPLSWLFSCACFAHAEFALIV